MGDHGWGVGGGVGGLSGSKQYKTGGGWVVKVGGGGLEQTICTA